MVTEVTLLEEDLILDYIDTGDKKKWHLDFMLVQIALIQCLLNNFRSFRSCVDMVVGGDAP